MTRMTALAYFGVASLHSPLMMLGIAAVGSVTALTLLLDGQAGTRAVVPVVIVQLFAASTGFAVRARRGHLDLLLTGGTSRSRVAVAHLVMSAAPGLIVWLLVGLVEFAGRPPRLTVWTSGSAAAMALVSGISWAVTVPFPRLSGAIGWTLLGVTILTIVPGAPVAVSGGAAGPGLTPVLVIACPFSVAGRSLAAGDALGVGSALGVAAAAVAGALLWITRADVALEAAQ